VILPGDLWGAIPVVVPAPVDFWPVDTNYFVNAAPVVVPGFYAGSFADRQQRFYMRSLRRGGFDLPYLSAEVLWGANGCEDDSCW